MLSGAMKSAKLLRRKSARISLFLAKLSSSNVKAVALTREPENEGENQDISLEAIFTLSMAGYIDMFFFRCFCS